MATPNLTVSQCDEVFRIWKDYNKKLTGNDEPSYEKGSLFGFIARIKPNYQTEILDILYSAGFEAGRKAATA